MLVYGDHAERVHTRTALAALSARLDAPLLRHDDLLDIFVDLAGIAQGVADEDFAQHGADRHRPAEALLLEQLTGLGALLHRSWIEGRNSVSPLGGLTIPSTLPEVIEVKLAEGYAFYALRPEAYALAARELRLLAPPRVIGLRSIGTGLACMASAAIGASPPVTLRPVGDPYCRKPRISEDLAADLLAGNPHFVIVDEGPGLSGSSFGGVADWLEQHGVSPDRIAFLPGHANPLGPQAPARLRARWDAAQKPVVTLDVPRDHEIDQLVGPLRRPLQDLSGGAWRPLQQPAEGRWPAVNPRWERRKFLATTADGEWLIKWAGLGAAAEAKLRLARHLEGWIPEMVGRTGGWVACRWHADAVSARPTIAELAFYLRRRATIPAATPGASLDLLLSMVRRNVPALAHWPPDLSDLAVRPVCTDNRMAVCEWLRLPNGRLLKADALDHHQAHDLIGCQDIAWDIAGASVELGLAPAETEELCRGLGTDARLLGFYLTAYRAFRIGVHRMTAESLGDWPAEQRRNLAAAEKLEAGLASVDAVKQPSHAR